LKKENSLDSYTNDEVSALRLKRYRTPDEPMIAAWPDVTDITTVSTLLQG